MSDEIPGPEVSKPSDEAGFDDLARRAGAALRRPAPDDGVRAITRRHRRQQALKATVVGGVAVAAFVGTLAFAANRNEPDSLTPVDSLPATPPATTIPAPPIATVAPEATDSPIVDTTPSTGLAPVDSSPAKPGATATSGTDGGAAFAAAIEASGLLTSPAADDVAQATDPDLYKDDFARTDVSASGNYVSLRTQTCRDDAFGVCGTGWAYVTGTADGGEMHGGMLGEASHLDLHLLDERYFVASESLPDTQALSTAWLIDAVSGNSAALSWRDEPTTLTSPEQTLLLCQDSYNTYCASVPPTDATTTSSSLRTEGGLPKVVDARDGTIRPLAMPDDVVAGLSIAQHGTDRIWVGTDPDGDELGLAYSDDGGATWTDVALPDLLVATNAELEIAADDDRVAVALSWGWPRGAERDELYVSNDAGRTWTTASPFDSEGANGAQLYVLADGRLVLMWSNDARPRQLLVSSGSDWAELDNVDKFISSGTGLSGGVKYFSVNRAGIAVNPSFISPCEGTICVGVNDNRPITDKVAFTSDLTNWTTIELLDD